MPPATGCPLAGPPSPEVTGAFCRVPSTPFSQAPRYSLPVHLCRFRVRSLTSGLFPGRIQQPGQSNKAELHFTFVTSDWPGNINPVPIDYGFRPRLRGRLTLRGLALRRNPWTFGDRVSHSVYRYSCQHSHFRYLQHPSQDTFTGLRNAPLPRRRQMSDVRCQVSDVSYQMSEPDRAGGAICHLSSVTCHLVTVICRLATASGIRSFGAWL